MKELKASVKIVQKMTRDGLVEVNKATGGEERISARDTAEDVIDTGTTALVFSEHNAAKKQAVKKANDGIFRHGQKNPDSKAESKATFRQTKTQMGDKTAASKEQASKAKRTIYKRQIQRNYAKAFRESQRTVEGAKNTAKAARLTMRKTRETARRAAGFVVRHRNGVLLFSGAAALVVMVIMGISSCASMFGGGFNAVIATSYTAEDEDILGADADYTALESNLAIRIANIETEYPGYDEYRYSVTEISHNPFELASYLTAKFYMYTRTQVQAELRSLFTQQYRLTLTPVTEVRYRTESRTGTYTWTDVYGIEHTETYTYNVEVPYNYYILNVTLTNRSLGSVALNNLNPEQREMYHVYMETFGNKPELFAGNIYAGLGEYLHYTIPPEALTDAVFAAMMREAEKYLGYPYVWGGSSPSTSFDCSGFVSWVINHSGWDVGRLGAGGLFRICTPVSSANARPGDLIFFTGTYDTPGISHVGIYVGGGMMIHCGNPISYANVNSPYWQSHYYTYGRLP
jgi:hypothetical protein